MKRWLLTFVFVLATFAVSAQISTAKVLELVGITSTVRDGLTINAGEYPVIYNTTTAQFERYNGSAWEEWSASFTETNDLSSAVTWANVPNANITEGSVTQHQAALSITESQISDLSHVTVSDAIYGVAWNGNTDAATKNAIYDKIETLGSSSVSELSDLSDVNTSTPTNRNVLVADGVDFESRALVEADISDLSHTTDTNLDIASSAEVNTGTNNTKAISPLALAGSQLQTDVTANNAKVTNATHTGDVTGSTALTIAAGAVSSLEIATAGVANEDLAPNSVTNDKISASGGSALNLLRINAGVTGSEWFDGSTVFAALSGASFTGDVTIDDTASNFVITNSSLGGVDPAITFERVSTYFEILNEESEDQAATSAIRLTDGGRVELIGGVEMPDEAPASVTEMVVLNTSGELSTQAIPSGSNGKTIRANGVDQTDQPNLNLIFDTAIPRGAFVTVTNDGGNSETEVTIDDAIKVDSESDEATINIGIADDQASLDAMTLAANDVVFCADCSPMNVIASATWDTDNGAVTMDGWKGVDESTVDEATWTFSDCDPGDRFTVWINRTSAPTLAGTGLTFNLLPNTAAFASGTEMGVYFEVGMNGTTVDYYYYER